MSTLRAARGLFEGGGRQNSDTSLDFCLLRWPRGGFLKAAVDKIPTLLSIFVYFDGRAGAFGVKS